MTQNNELKDTKMLNKAERNCGFISMSDYITNSQDVDENILISTAL